MSYQLSITNDEINILPMYKFEGTISLIESEKEAVEAALKLKDESLLGFDTETRAAFKKGESYSVSLLQLATDTHSYLFRLNKFPLIKELVDILENPNIVKAGVAVRDDVKALNKLSKFSESNFVDLAVIAKEKKIEKFGLRALTAILLQKRLSKKAKISNWERVELTPMQIEYAACDAVVGYEIYQKLVKS
jgi:ribonuclease D